MLEKPPIKEEENNEEQPKNESREKSYIEIAQDSNPKIAVNSATHKMSQSQGIKNNQETNVRTSTPTYDAEKFNTILSLLGERTTPADPTQKTYLTQQGERLQRAVAPQTEQESISSIYDIYDEGFINVNGRKKRKLKEGYFYDDKGNIVNYNNELVFSNVPDRYGRKDIDWLMDKLSKNKLTRAEYEALDLRKKGLVQGLGNLITSLGDAYVATNVKGRDVAPVQARNFENPYFAQAEQREALGQQEEAEYYKQLQNIENDKRDDVLKALEMSRGEQTISEGEGQTISQSTDETSSIEVNTDDYYKDLDASLERSKLQLDREKFKFEKGKENPVMNLTFNTPIGVQGFVAKDIVTKDGKYKEPQITASYENAMKYLEVLYPNTLDQKALLDYTIGEDGYDVSYKKDENGKYKFFATPKYSSGTFGSTKVLQVTNDMKLRLINAVIQKAITDDNEDALLEVGESIGLIPQ